MGGRETESGRVKRRRGWRFAESILGKETGLLQRERVVGEDGVGGKTRDLRVSQDDSSSITAKRPFLLPWQ